MAIAIWMTFRMTDNNRCQFLHSDGKRLSYPPRWFLRPDIGRISEHIIKTHTPWCISKTWIGNIPAPAVSEQVKYFPEVINPWKEYIQSKPDMTDNERNRILNIIEKEQDEEVREKIHNITHPLIWDEIYINNNIWDYLWAREMQNKGRIGFSREWTYKYKKAKVLKKNWILLRCRSINSKYLSRNIGFVNVFEMYDILEKYIIANHIKKKCRSDIYSHREWSILERIKNSIPK